MYLYRLHRVELKRAKKRVSDLESQDAQCRAAQNEMLSRQREASAATGGVKCKSYTMRETFGFAEWAVLGLMGWDLLAPVLVLDHC